MTSPSIWQAVLTSALVATAISGCVQLTSGWLERRGQGRRDTQQDQRRVYLECIELVFQMPVTETTWPGKEDSSTTLEDFNRLLASLYVFGTKRAVIAIDGVQAGISAFFRESATFWRSHTEPIGVGDRMDANQEIWRGTVLPPLMGFIEVVRDELGIEPLPVRPV
jgi:hypothetical protein